MYPVVSSLSKQLFPMGTNFLGNCFKDEILSSPHQYEYFISLIQKLEMKILYVIMEF